MPPYGTPPHPYVAMYPPGGIYAHPSMPPVFFVKLCFLQVIMLNLWLINYFCLKFMQGSYPFSPFAMPSPNGIAEASVSFPFCILFSFSPFLFLCLFPLLCKTCPYPIKEK